MASPPDDTASARPAELAERRARRAVEDGLTERAERAERTVGALERRLDEAEGRLEVAQRERSTLAASLHQARRDLTVALQREFAEGRLRVEQEGEASAAAAELDAVISRLEADHATAENRAVALTRALQEARRDLDVARADRPAIDAERERSEQVIGTMEREHRLTSLRLAEAREALGARQAELVAAEDRIADREAELEQARVRTGDRAEHEVAVELLVGDLVETVDALRAGFQRELEGLAAERDAAVGRERERFTTELIDVERRVDELTRAVERLHEELAEERGARGVAEAELVRLRAAGAVNPFYEMPPAGPLVVSADHPALARTAPPMSPPAVVADLARAMDRLRDGEDAQASSPVAEPATTSTAIPPHDVSGDRTEVAAAPGPVPAHEVDAASDWFSRRLAAFASTDGAAAERLLLASLAVQATAVGKDVTYELELPGSGRHRVAVARGGGVSVEPVHPGWPQEVEFRLEGPVSALATLAGGSAPRRLSGASVRGRRRRLRRLLRALGAPVGLARLRSADARPAAADLLAMLCDGVPGEQHAGADFAVAYDVAGVPGGDRSRTVVRAWPDGRLGLDGDTTQTPDAVISLDGPDLLGLLDGSLSATVDGNRSAADTLHQWLRGVQGL